MACGCIIRQFSVLTWSKTTHSSSDEGGKKREFDPKCFDNLKHPTSWITFEQIFLQDLYLLIIRIEMLVSKISVNVSVLVVKIQAVWQPWLDTSSKTCWSKLISESTKHNGLSLQLSSCITLSSYFTSAQYEVFF